MAKNTPHRSSFDVAQRASFREATEFAPIQTQKRRRIDIERHVDFGFN